MTVQVVVTVDMNDHWAAISASSRDLVALNWNAGKKQENTIWKQAQQILRSYPCGEASCGEIVL